MAYERMGIMRIHRFLALAAVLLVVMGMRVARGDSIQEADAKRRGVPIEVVELEDAKSRIAYLEKQNAELMAKIDALKKQLAVTVSPPTPLPISEPIAAAIKEHRLIQGMTISQAKQAIDGVWAISSDRDSEQTWECKWTEINTDPQNESFSLVVVASADFTNGIITSCETKTDVMKIETDFGNGPYAKNAAKKLGR